MTTPPIASRKATRAPDPRTGRTRAAIVNGLTTLLREGRTDPTVREVVAAAGVSRASFYTHFTGVDEVAVVLLRQTFSRLGEMYVDERRRLGMRTAASVRAGQARLADAFWQQRDLLEPLLASSSSGAVQLEITRAFADTVEGLLRIEKSRMPSGIDMRVASVAVANTLIGLITAWITGDLDIDRDTLVDHLVAMLPAWMAEPDSPTAD